MIASISVGDFKPTAEAEILTGRCGTIPTLVFHLAAILS